MLIVFAIILIVLAVIILILTLPVKVRLDFRNLYLEAKVTLFKVPIYKWHSKDKEDPSSTITIEDQVKEFEGQTITIGEEIKLLIEFFKSVFYLLEHYVTVRYLSLKVKVGTGDAATTAVSVGIVWASVYNLLGIVSRLVDIDDHKVESTPDYNEQIFLVDGNCIIKTKLFMLFIYAYLKKNFEKIISREGKED